MVNMMRCMFVLAGVFVGVCLCDFACVCNYKEQNDVLGAPDLGAKTIGTLYEFDCKPLYRDPATNTTGYMAIHFENKVGYVKVDSQVMEQLCPGNPSPDDLFTTKHPPSTPTFETTTVSSTITPSSTLSSSTVAASVRTVQTTPTTSSSSSEHTSDSTPIITTHISPTPVSLISASISSTTVSASTQSTPLTATSTAPSSSSTLLMSTIQPMRHGMNVTGTALEYIGVGYNLLHGNPDGNPYGTAHIDEGFKLNSRILQLTETEQGSVFEAQFMSNGSSCEPTTHASFVVDEKSYQEQTANIVKPSTTHPTELLEKAFTLSIEYKHLYPPDAPTMNIYRDITTTCITGRARYNTEDVTNEEFSVTEEFASAVCQLPQTYDIVPYIKFLETWGTSVVVSTQLGHRTTRRYHVNLLQAFDHVQRLVPDLIQHTGAYLGYSASLSIDVSNYTAAQSTLADVFGTLQSTIQMGGPDGNVPIAVNVVPITYALDQNFWNKIMDSGYISRTCPSWFTLSTVTTNVNQALTSYATLMAAPEVHIVPLRMPVTWPTGTYGLMKPSSGCPRGTGGPGVHVHWLEGWRKQDTEDHDAANHYSPDILQYIDGQFEVNNMVTHYCIKNGTSVTVYDRVWPAGQYCILQYITCPTGFAGGSLTWDDEDDHNSNALEGTLPSGNYGKNTKIFYCCRTDGAVSRSISLPTDSPFLLLRYGSTCQSVYGMKTTELFIRWDDEDGHNHDDRVGVYPSDDGGPKDHRLHFCHYKAEAGTSANQDGTFVPSLVG